VLVSVDGLRPDAISPDWAPRLWELQAAGVRAEGALNDMPSATLPNHATMLTGLVSDLHGVNLNVELPGTIEARTLFDYTAAAGLRGAFYACKSKLRHLAREGALETVDVGGGEAAGRVARLLTQLTPDGPDVFFLHLNDPDSTGHRAGWMSDEYLRAVTEMDALIGQIVDAIAADGTRETYLLVTADHGGAGTNHFLNIREDREIPWIVTGPDIPPGIVLDAVVTSADTTPTALWLLGVEAPPGLSGVARTSITDPDQLEPIVIPVAPAGLPCIFFFMPGLVAVWVAVHRTRPLDAKTYPKAANLAACGRDARTPHRFRDRF